MNEEEGDWADKVFTVFEPFGDRRKSLDGGRTAYEAQERIVSALEGRYGIETAYNIAFHLSDWNSDAAFIVALHLNPQDFTDLEVQEGIQAFLYHAPHHVMAAAALGGYELRDVFDVGIKVEPPLPE